MWRMIFMYPLTLRMHAKNQNQRKNVRVKVGKTGMRIGTGTGEKIERMRIENTVMRSRVLGRVGQMTDIIQI